MTSLSTDFTDKLFAEYEANAKYSAIENAVTHNGLLKSIETRQSEVENDHVFSIDLTKDEVSNQKASGRCWMFAALNTFRHKLISDFKLESFELSQAHTFFWDKYEKSNWFLEQIIATADQEIGSRKVKFLLDTPQQDGGQWDMVVSLFEKYGVQDIPAGTLLLSLKNPTILYWHDSENSFPRLRQLIKDCLLHRYYTLKILICLIQVFLALRR